MPVGMFDRLPGPWRLLLSLEGEPLPDLSRLIGFPTSSTVERGWPGLFTPCRIGALGL